MDKSHPGYPLYLLGRLKNYFSLKIDRHGFFDVWEKALNLLGHSYLTDAAHVDVSPRPLISMQTIGKLGRKDSRGHKKLYEYRKCKAQFQCALESDVKWLFELIQHIPDLTCILMAGNLIISPAHLDLWLKLHTPSGWRLSLDHPASDRESKPKRSFGTLTAPAQGGEVPRRFGIFWCSISPNAAAFGNDPELLVQTVASNLEVLRVLGCSQSHTD